MSSPITRIEGARRELVVIVPTYNTAPTAPGVVRALLVDSAGAVDHVVVIDNASQDGTLAAIRNLCAQEPELAPRVTLIQNPRNLGYGGSIKLAFALVAEKYPLISIMHSDDQCDAARTMRDMVAAMGARERPEAALASRFCGDADTREYSWSRRLGNRFFNVLTRRVSGLPMSDAGTAIMIIQSSALRCLPYSDLTSGYRYHCQLNLLIYGNPTFTIAEVPLTWRNASVGVPFSLVRYGVALLRLLGAFAWRRRFLRRSLDESVRASEREA